MNLSFASPQPGDLPTTSRGALAQPGLLLAWKTRSRHWRRIYLLPWQQQWKPSSRSIRAPPRRSLPWLRSFVANSTSVHPFCVTSPGTSVCCSVLVRAAVCSLLPFTAWQNTWRDSPFPAPGWPGVRNTTLCPNGLKSSKVGSRPWPSTLSPDRCSRRFSVLECSFTSELFWHLCWSITPRAMVKLCTR